MFFFFFSSRRRHTRCSRDWSSDVCSSDLEKLNAPTGEEAILNMGTGVDREWEAAFGLTAPPCFALAAQRHMAAYGTTEEQLAMVGVKNHTQDRKSVV